MKLPACAAEPPMCDTVSRCAGTASGPRRAVAVSAGRTGTADRRPAQLDDSEGHRLPWGWGSMGEDERRPKGGGQMGS